MKIEIQIAGRTRSVRAIRAEDRVEYELDGSRVDADAVEITRGVYSILIGGESFEVRVEARGAGLLVKVDGRDLAAEIVDRRQLRRDRRTGFVAEGRQQVVAPMPGKVIRVLVRAGDAVEAGQGLAVVEAMKMQNEVRTPKSGRVERMLVSEGQAVNAGDILAVVA
jgi:biotin carboxyl carrier protein